MPENKNPTNPAPMLTGAGKEEFINEVENIIRDERFKSIVEDCIIDCYKDCELCNYEKCLRRCLKVAWILYHAWYVDSAATSSSQSAA